MCPTMPQKILQNIQMHSQYVCTQLNILPDWWKMYFFLLYNYRYILGDGGIVSGHSH